LDLTANPSMRAWAAIECSESSFRMSCNTISATPFRNQQPQFSACDNREAAQCATTTSAAGSCCETRFWKNIGVPVNHDDAEVHIYSKIEVSYPCVPNMIQSTTRGREICISKGGVHTSVASIKLELSSHFCTNVPMAFITARTP
jgi:hypothetical protein